MSISLPNGTLLATPATQTQYSAAVTRILHLANFPPELKTRDLQNMFKDFETEKGGFRIKWLDDTNALAVFGEASVAKRAYLSFLLRPPSNFSAPAQIKPYDKPDAGQIIATLTARAMGHRSSMSSAQTQNENPNGANFATSSHSHIRAPSMSNGTSDQNSRQSQHHPSSGSFSFPKQRTSISNSTSSGVSNSISLVNNARHQRTGSASSFSRSSTGLGVLNFGGMGGTPTKLPTHAESLDSPAAYIPAFPSRRTTKDSERERELNQRSNNKTPMLNRENSNSSRNGVESNSSSDNEPILILDHAPTPKLGNGNNRRSNSNSGAGGMGGWKMPGTGGSSGMNTTGAASGGGRRDSVSAEKALREVEKALAGVEAR